MVSFDSDQEFTKWKMCSPKVQHRVNIGVGRGDYLVDVGQEIFDCLEPPQGEEASGIRGGGSVRHPGGCSLRDRGPGLPLGCQAEDGGCCCTW